VTHPQRPSDDSAHDGEPTAPLVWREGWRLGIDVLDVDHQKLVALLNVVLAAARPAADVAQPSRAAATPRPCPDRQLAGLQALVEHLRAHFRREESFMAAIGYPDLAPPPQRACHTARRAHDLLAAAGDGGRRAAR
jgi:hemerythrin